MRLTLLVCSAAKLEQETPAGKTCLHEACAEGQFGAAQLLLGRGVKVCCILTLCWGTDPVLLWQIQKENRWGRTALMDAALHGRCEVPFTKEKNLILMLR